VKSNRFSKPVRFEVIDNYLDLPKFYCHSMNSVGKENIESLLKNFKKW